MIPPFQAKSFHVSIAKVGEEFGPGCLWRRVFPASLGDIRMAFLRLSLSLATEVWINILPGLLHIQGYICGIPWRFWDSQAEVKGQKSRDRPERNNAAPHLIGSELATVVTVRRGRRWQQCVLGSDDGNEGDQRRC